MHATDTSAEIRVVLLLASLPLIWVVRRRGAATRWWCRSRRRRELASRRHRDSRARVCRRRDAARGTGRHVPRHRDEHVARRPRVARLIVFDRDPDAGRSARRFSPVALSSVIVIVVTGLFATWRQVGFSSRRVPRHLLRPVAARKGGGVHRAGRAGRVEPPDRPTRHKPATLSAMAVTEESAPTRTAPADPERSSPAMVGRRRARLRHRGVGDHRAARERAAGARRARAPVHQGVPHAEDAGRHDRRPREGRARRHAHLYTSHRPAGTCSRRASRPR